VFRFLGKNSLKTKIFATSSSNIKLSSCKR
jgi:hypothetical protein